MVINEQLANNPLQNLALIVSVDCVDLAVTPTLARKNPAVKRMDNCYGTTIIDQEYVNEKGIQRSKVSTGIDGLPEFDIEEAVTTEGFNVITINHEGDPVLNNGSNVFTQAIMRHLGNGSYSLHIQHQLAGGTAALADCKYKSKNAINQVKVVNKRIDGRVEDHSIEDNHGNDTLKAILSKQVGLVINSFGLTNEHLNKLNPTAEMNYRTHSICGWMGKQDTLDSTYTKHGEEKEFYDEEKRQLGELLTEAEPYWEDLYNNEFDGRIKAFSPDYTHRREKAFAVFGAKDMLLREFLEDPTKKKHNLRKRKP